jgi:exoribonuclease II
VAPPEISELENTGLTRKDLDTLDLICIESIAITDPEDIDWAEYGSNPAMNLVRDRAEQFRLQLESLPVDPE